MAFLMQPSITRVRSRNPAPEQSALIRVAWALFLVSVIWAPLPLGSNRPWAAALLVLWQWALLLAVLAIGLRRPQLSATWPSRVLSAKWPLLLLLGFCTLLGLQLMPAWPPALRMAWLPLSMPVGGGNLPGAMTLDAAATSRFLVNSLGHLASFVLVLLLCDSRKRVQWLLATLLASGVLQALLAVVLGAGDGHYQLFFHEFKQGTRATGTFPNPDHLAGYMELCIAAGMGLMISQFASSTDRTHRDNRKEAFLRVFKLVLSTKMLVRLMLVILIIALVKTHSRMGNGVVLLSMMVVAAAAAVASPQLRRPISWLLASMLLVDVIVVGQWVGLSRVVERVSGTSIALEASQASAERLEVVRDYREETLLARMDAPRAALDLALDAPWTGHGGGTFFTAFPPFKTDEVYPQYFEHAHNDYAEIAADTGFLGLLLLLGIGFTSVVLAARMLHDDQPQLRRSVGIAVLIAALSLGLHSIVDFNLQIFAVSSGFTCLLALAWATNATPVKALRTQSTERGSATSPRDR